MGSSPGLAFVWMILATLSLRCGGGKVLVYPIDGSHWINMKILVESLHSQGHEITVIRSSTSWYVSETSPYYTSITVKQEHSQNIEDQNFMSLFLKRSIDIRRSRGTLRGFLNFYQNLFQMLRENQQVVANLFSSIFENQTLIKELQHSQ